jgi:hypothetical protein
MRSAFRLAVFCSDHQAVDTGPGGHWVTGRENYHGHPSLNQVCSQSASVGNDRLYSRYARKPHRDQPG